MLPVSRLYWSQQKGLTCGLYGPEKAQLWRSFVVLDVGRFHPRTTTGIWCGMSLNTDPLVWQITAIVGIALILITFYRINKED